MTAMRDAASQCTRRAWAAVVSPAARGGETAGACAQGLRGDVARLTRGDRGVGRLRDEDDPRMTDGTVELIAWEVMQGGEMEGWDLVAPWSSRGLTGGEGWQNGRGMCTGAVWGRGEALLGVAGWEDLATSRGRQNFPNPNIEPDPELPELY